MAELASRTYSGALFEVAQEKSMIDQILAEYVVVAESMHDHPEFYEVLVSPNLTVDEKKKIIDTTYGTQICAELLNFFKLLMDKKRGGVILDAFKDFKALVDDHKGYVVAEVESVIPLSEKNVKTLEEKLNQVTGKTVTVKNIINPEIMGGLVVKVGDKIIDGSIKRKLESMKHDLAQIII